MSKIGIRCDCGTVMGMGHVFRQKFIYEELIKLDHEVYFFVKKERDIVKSLGLPLYKMHLIDTMDVLIIDLIEDFEHYDFPRIKIILYDGPEMKNCDADIVFAFHHNQQKSWYKNKKYFIGYKYILMNPALSKIDRETKNLKNILIMTSGIDPWNMPKQILKFIKDGKYNVTIKLSSAYPKEWVKDIENDARIIVNEKDIPSLYKEHDLMICTAGTVLYEAAASGLPCITFSTGKVQETYGTFMNDMGFSIHLGGFWNNTAKIGYLSNAIRHLSDVKGREERSKIGRSICDGKGLNRVIKIITEEIT